MGAPEQTRTAGMIGDFREYMRLKNEKLREQFSEQQDKANGSSGGLFAGVCIWVDGFTRPSHLVSSRPYLRGPAMVHHLYVDAMCCTHRS